MMPGPGVPWAPRLPSKGPWVHGPKGLGPGQEFVNVLDFTWGPEQAIFGISWKFAAQGACRYSIWSRERPNHEIPQPWAQMGPGSKRALGPMGPGPKRALGPTGPGQMGQGKMGQAK